MIKYLRHTEINKTKWDETISSSPHSLVYALSWYLDIVSPDWDALVEDDYSSVFPLTYRKKAGINYLYQPYFTQQLGLFSKENNCSEKKLREFVSAIPHKFRLIEIQLNVSNILNQFDSYKILNKKTHHLELSTSYEKICTNYSENLRRNLKRSGKTDFKIIKNVLPYETVAIFRKNKGKEINNLKLNDFSTFLKLAEAAKTHNVLDSRGIVNSSGVLISGAIFLKSAHSYIFLFSGLNKEGREKGAMSAIIDSFIKDHCNEKRFLDFEGSMDENLSRFYKSFGSKEVVYLQILKNNLPRIIRWLKQQ